MTTGFARRVTPGDFVRAELPRLYRIALALCGSPAAAEDLVSEAVTRSLAHWDDITGSPVAYVRRAMVNLRLNERRHADAGPGPAATTIEPDPAERAADRIEVQRILAPLTDQQRTVLVLRFLADLSVADVAATLGRPAGTIRRITHDALTIVRGNLQAGPAGVTENQPEGARHEG